MRQGVVLWEHGSVSCACLHVAPDHIEVTLAVDGVVVQKQTFSDHNAASEFAIDKMHVYDAP
jgi:hypothetical protein